MEWLKNRFKSIDKVVLSMALLLLLIVFVRLLSIYRTSSSIGAGVGEDVGRLVGNLVGSIEGYKSGREDGLRDAQTPKVEVDIKERISEMGLLEVLVVDLEYIDVYKTSEKDTKYAEAFSEKVSVVFTVNMNNVKVTENEDGSVKILLPHIQYPRGSWIMGSYKRIDTYPKKTGVGSTIGGIEQENINHQQLIKKVEEDVYGNYLNQARSSAKTQVESLARAITGRDVIVVGAWEEDGNG